MEVVKISSKFQVIIPKEMRERLQLFPGQRMQVVAYGNRIEMIPEQKIDRMRGSFRGSTPPCRARMTGCERRRFVRLTRIPF